jgi:hypothetical protein
MTTHFESALGGEVSPTKNETFFTDLDLHDGAVKKFPDGVAWKVAHNPVADEE